MDDGVTPGPESGDLFDEIAIAFLYGGLYGLAGQVVNAIFELANHSGNEALAHRAAQRCVLRWIHQQDGFTFGGEVIVAVGFHAYPTRVGREEIRLGRHRSHRPIAGHRPETAALGHPAARGRFDPADGCLAPVEIEAPVRGSVPKGHGVREIDGRIGHGSPV